MARAPEAKRTNLLSLLLISSFLLSHDLQSVSAGKILAVEFFGSKSHVMTYLPLLEELARRGHEVTLLSPTKGLPKEKSIREIFTNMDFDSIFGEMNMFDMKEANEDTNPFSLLAELLPLKCQDVYNMSEVKDLMTRKFDLVLLQPMFNDCALGLIHKLQAPWIMFTPTSAPNFVVERLGGFYPSSIVSNLFLTFTDEMNFVERLQNFGFNIFIEAVMKYYYEPIMQAAYRDVLGADVPSVREILGTASLMLSNGHFSVHRPKPNLPDVIDIGGLHSRPAKPLPKDLEDFVSKSGSDGFILFSMGSVAQGNKMSEAKRNVFLNTFAKLKQQVIWKWETETMSNLPKNVKLSKWLPQQDLLGHKDIKMFITHCGGGSTEEAIYHGAPLLGLPLFGDQPVNARQASNHGFLHKMEWNDLTEESLTAAINEVLNNPKYMDNVKRLSTIFKDQPDSPLQRGVYWMEYVMRHKGAPHLKSAARNLNTFQYHSLDVIATYLAMIFGTIYLFFAISRFVIKKICGSSSAKKNIESVSPNGTKNIINQR